MIHGIEQLRGYERSLQKSTRTRVVRKFPVGNGLPRLAWWPNSGQFHRGLVDDKWRPKVGDQSGPGLHQPMKTVSWTAVLGT